MDDKITYITAVLAKEKGFTHGVAQQVGGYQYNYYNSDGSEGVIGWGHLHQDSPTICPQSILQKWLREEHNMFVYVIDDKDTKKYYWGVSRLFSGETENDSSENPDSETYEEAFEEGLEEGLKLIKKKDEVV